MEHHYLKRRLKWFGRVIRADDSTPAKSVFNCAISPFQIPCGKPVSTWLSIIRSSIKKLNLTWEETINIVENI